jgi:CO/xanthine dehydrogenase FAD-binding subunit
VPYYRPTEPTSALKLMAQTGGKIIAGGTDVYPSAQQGIQPNYFLDVTAISGLAGISRDANGTRIGASVTWHQFVKADFPRADTAYRRTKNAAGVKTVLNVDYNEGFGHVTSELCWYGP